MILINYFFIGFTAIIKFPFYSIKYFIKGLITISTLIPKYLLIGIKYITEKKDPNKQDQDILGNKLIPSIIITLSLITYLLSVFIISRWYVQNERSKKFADSLTKDFLSINQNTNKNTPDQYQDLTSTIIQETTENNNHNNYKNNTQENTNYINANLDYYIQKNNETVAWIQVNNTNINYPIVQHDDNSFYLNHDFYKRKTNNGWVFADYRDNFDTFNNNTIIYAHNLINRTMFGQIPYLLKKKWFQNNNSHYIKLSTKTTNSIWQIFSVYKIEPTTDYLQSNFNSINTYQEFLNKIKERSEQKLNVDITYTDKIITLSTCDDTGTKRIAVHAKLINIENKNE